MDFFLPSPDVELHPTMNLMFIPAASGPKSEITALQIHDARVTDCRSMVGALEDRSITLRDIPFVASWTL